jgi:magnesium-transporting ATPase (P-type)
MVDEYVLNQLSPKEKIEYQHEVGGITWIATNKRVLKFRKSWTGSKSLRDLDYKHIVSINLEETRYYWLSIIAILLIIFGLFFIYLINIDPFIKLIIFILMVLFAILFLIAAIFAGSSYYEFNASSINWEEWKMEDTKSIEAKELIQTIRKHCFFEERPERVRYCPRCGSENPENSNYCSSCGAPLKF